MEFNIAKVFDTLLIKLTLLHYFPIWLGNLLLGVVAAKCIADVTFYVPIKMSYELSKKFEKF